MAEEDNKYIPVKKKNCCKHKLKKKELHIEKKALYITYAGISLNY